MPKVLEDCVQKLTDKGHSESSAWAICRTSLKMKRAEEPDERIMEYAEEVAKNFSVETFDMPNQEVFAAGTWNGDRYDVNDLDKMVEAYQKTAETYKPKLKLTHDHPKGWPAVGWVENLRRVGDKLVADFKRIPRKVYDMIQSGGFNGKSAEILWNPVVGGEKYQYLMKAVALLGVDPKAVESISDMVSALYTSDGGEARAYQAADLDGNARAYDLEKQEDANMELEQLKKSLADANTKNAELAGQVAAYAKAEADLKKAASDAETKASDAVKRAEKAEGEIKAYAAKDLESRITATVDKLVSTKKLAPSRKEYAKTMLMAIAGVGERKYSVGGKDATLEEMAVELLGAGGVELPTETKSYAGEKQPHTEEGVDSEGFVNSDLDAKAKEYMSKHPGKSYKDSLREVAATAGK